MEMDGNAINQINIKVRTFKKLYVYFSMLKP